MALELIDWIHLDDLVDDVGVSFRGLLPWLYESIRKAVLDVVVLLRLGM